MATLKVLHAQIERKTSSINKVEDYLNENPNSSISDGMRKSLKRYTLERENLQSQFDNIYNEFN